ncbi:hypothetical protein BHE74_00040301 [Ensete ventricosum]|nr:hypothetical protein BHE74_00040301 [Ensete ventricosum]RZS16535.1 hypothetical protein BHM03_00048531 [Ensete ventricosum]
MLTAPNEKNRPLFAAKDVLSFYMEHSSKIFPQTCVAIAGAIQSIRRILGPKCSGERVHHIIKERLGRSKLHKALTNVRRILGPKYSGEYLHHIIKERLGSLKLHQALTNVVIPTFDITQLQPTIFSSYKVLLPRMKPPFSSFFLTICTLISFFIILSK